MKATTWLFGALITFILWRGPLTVGYITWSVLRGVAGWPGWPGWAGVEYELPAPAAHGRISEAL
jgi:hypothetical protein